MLCLEIQLQFSSFTASFWRVCCGRLALPYKRMIVHTVLPTQHCRAAWRRLQSGTGMEARKSGHRSPVHYSASWVNLRHD